MTLTADFNPNVSVPFSRMRYLLQESGGGLQAGVVGATDLKVVQRGAGANMSVDVGTGGGWVAVTTGTRNGLAHCFNDATANVAVTASNATNPRIDQIYLRYNDSSIPTGSGDIPTLVVATGTATVGATLDNRTGAAALPADSLRLADILVPATSTSVVTANIRDRRPWARGAHTVATSTGSSGNNFTTSLIDTGLFSVVLECSGAPLRIDARCFIGSTSAGVFAVAAVFMDGVEQTRYRVRTEGTGNYSSAAPARTITPAAGRHTFALFGSTTGGTGNMSNTAGDIHELSFTEIVRPNANNS